MYNNNFSNFLPDLSSPMICAKIHPEASSALEKKIFKGFYHIWAWRPSWSMDRDHFSNLSFPQPKVAPHEIWTTLAQRLQRSSHLKFSTFFPYKCMLPIQMHREANLTCKKVKCQYTTIILATLVDLLSPMCKDSAPRHPWFWRRF